MWLTQSVFRWSYETFLSWIKKIKTCTIKKKKKKQPKEKQLPPSCQPEERRELLPRSLTRRVTSLTMSTNITIPHWHQSVNGELMAVLRGRPSGMMHCQHSLKDSFHARCGAPFMRSAGGHTPEHNENKWLSVLSCSLELHLRELCGVFRRSGLFWTLCFHICTIKKKKKKKKKRTKEEF